MEKDTPLWKKRKNSPRFIGPYEILENVGPVAYRLALPLELAKLHDVFHVFMLQRYRSDTSHILLVQDIQVQVATSWYERSNMGTRIDNEGTVPSTLQFR